MFKRRRSKTKSSSSLGSASTSAHQRSSVGDGDSSVHSNGSSTSNHNNNNNKSCLRRNNNSPFTEDLSNRSLGGATENCSSSSTGDPTLHPQPAGKGVKFKEVLVREYERVIGDNPSCSNGAPVSIGWAYAAEIAIPIDEFEKLRMPTRRQSQSELVLSRQQRELTLMEWNFSVQDIIESIRANIKAKNQRRRTVNAIGTYDRMEEAMESASRKLKRSLFTGGKKYDVAHQPIHHHTTSYAHHIPHPIGYVNTNFAMTPEQRQHAAHHMVRAQHLQGRSSTSQPPQSSSPQYPHALRPAAAAHSTSPQYPHALAAAPGSPPQKQQQQQQYAPPPPRAMPPSSPQKPQQFMAMAPPPPPPSSPQKYDAPPESAPPPRYARSAAARPEAAPAALSAAGAAATTTLSGAAATSTKSAAETNGHRTVYDVDEASVAAPRTVYDVDEVTVVPTTVYDVDEATVGVDGTTVPQKQTKEEYTPAVITVDGPPEDVETPSVVAMEGSSTSSGDGETAAGMDADAVSLSGVSLSGISTGGDWHHPRKMFTYLGKTQQRHQKSEGCQHLYQHFQYQAKPQDKQGEQQQQYQIVLPSDDPRWHPDHRPTPLLQIDHYMDMTETSSLADPFSHHNSNHDDLLYGDGLDEEEYMDHRQPVFMMPLQQPIPISPEQLNDPAFLEFLNSGGALPLPMGGPPPHVIPPDNLQPVPSMVPPDQLRPMMQPLPQQSHPWQPLPPQQQQMIMGPDGSMMMVMPFDPHQHMPLDQMLQGGMSPFGSDGPTIAPPQGDPVPVVISEDDADGFDQLHDLSYAMMSTTSSSPAAAARGREIWDNQGFTLQPPPHSNAIISKWE